MNKSVFRFRAALVVASLSLGGLLMAAAPPNLAAWGSSATPVNNVAAELPAEIADVANSLSNAFRAVSAHVLPSVVAIETRPEVSAQSVDDGVQLDGQMFGRSNPFKGTPFEDMFRDAVPLNPGQMIPRRSPRSQTGIGSGVIIDSAGIVLTNNHVVAGGGIVMIRTQDGREFKATEVLTDPQSDIAVVKFKGDSSLVAVRIGDSDKMEVGDWVVALGQPFGLESTVTAGIVSAKNRGIGLTDRENFIQTDAAINPGNSGGPLVNLRGELIGINTAISSRGGGNNGVGFAIPSNLASWVSEQLLTNGQVNRSYLGVSIQPVSFELSSQLGVAPKSGVAVTNVFPDTPAAKSGLQVGDVIVKFGGIPVTTPQQLQLAVERSPMGSSVRVDVVRDGKSIEIIYQPEAAPGDFGVRAQSNSKSDGGQRRLLGLEVEALNDEVAAQLGMQGQSGLIITSVQDGSISDRVGLQPGMVIVQVNRTNVTTPAEFERAVKADDDGSILLLVRTEQGSRFVVINN